MHQHSTASNLKVAFLLNLSFTIFEIIGGVLTNSVAIISDSLHDLGDSFSLALAWILEHYSQREHTDTFTYGFKRFSIVGALINIIILIVGSIAIIYAVIPRLFNPESSNYGGMMVMAIIGIIVNGAAALRLHKGSKLSERVVSWHMLEDVLGWVSILVVSIVNQIKEIPILDPLLALMFTCVILFNIIKNCKQVILVFLQAAPSYIDMNELTQKLLTITGIDSVHDMHVWSLDDSSNVLTLHVVVGEIVDKEHVQTIKRKVKEIAETIKIQHTTVEIEYRNEYCKYTGEE